VSGVTFADLALPGAALTALAFVVDLAVGDPPSMPHPVVLMGKVIALLDRTLRPRFRPGFGRRAAGGLLALILVGGSYAATAVILGLVFRLSEAAGVVLEVLFIWTALAGRSLVEAGLAVLRPLRAGDLPAARRAVGRIVGRDTDEMDESEVCRAAVESLAENTSDGIISPAFWAIIGGAPLAIAFKAVSTLDSMVGYRNETYIDFGWASARLDDLANFLPARITGALLVVSAGLLGLNWRDAIRVARRDAAKHPSPNAGVPEAVVAGALGVTLGGVNRYSGKPSFRPHLGAPGSPVGPEHLRLTIRLVMVTIALSLAITAGAAGAAGAVRAAAVHAAGAVRAAGGCWL